jgi:hypothetical protein
MDSTNGPGKSAGVAPSSPPASRLLGRKRGLALGCQVQERQLAEAFTLRGLLVNDLGITAKSIGVHYGR